MKSKTFAGHMDGNKIDVEVYRKDDGQVTVVLRDPPLVRSYDAAPDGAEKLFRSVIRSCRLSESDAQALLVM